ncbi:uncharacterized protein LOC110978361 [Acanthaster planci]|uniref:Uncharacterized protein LOC110978361 n=1 Tax=Acanthaster planci TaxID=133434 RepID=A0A8B7Y9G1_ACAPL|nr:uncharacterized protein LOC110978361 [Acanthaster planci]
MDVSDIPEPTVRKKQPRKKSVKAKGLQPMSDNDPNPPSVYQPDYPPDEDGWTRALSDRNIHHFRGPAPPGPTFHRGVSPLHYFLRFFPLMLLAKMVDWTNQKLRTAGQKLTSLAEMRAFIGMQLLMGIVKVSSYQHYWSTHPGLHSKLISTTMTRNRFDQLNQSWSCNDPGKHPQKIQDKGRRFMYMKANPLYLLQPIWDEVRKRCLQKYYPRNGLLIDEAMIKYRANVKKFYTPLKPIRAGFKVYPLAEASTGFMINFKVHPSEKLPCQG